MSSSLSIVCHPFITQYHAFCFLVLIDPIQIKHMQIQFPSQVGEFVFVILVIETFIYFCRIFDMTLFLAGVPFLSVACSSSNSLWMVLFVKVGKVRLMVQKLYRTRQRLSQGAGHLPF